MRNLLIATLVVLVSASAVRAQPLADRVPDDVMLYVGWAGSETLGPAYANSKLKQFIDGSALPQLISETLPAVIKKAAAKDGNPFDVEMARQIWAITARRPSAFYFDMQFDAEGEPAPRIGFLCQAGPDREKLRELLARVIELTKDQEPAAKLYEQGDVIGMVSDDAAAASKSLATSAPFQTARPHLKADAALVVHINVAAGLARVESDLKDEFKPEQLQAWNRAIEAAGIRGLKSVNFSGGFAGDAWQTQSFWDAPMPRTGIVKLLEPLPIDASLLARIPSDVTSASIVNFDFAALISTARDIVNAADPQAGKMFQQGLGAVSMAVGRRLEGEILAPLGPQWAVYTSPGQGGKHLHGIIAANKLDDAKLAKAAWADFAFALSTTVPNLTRRIDVQVTPATDDKAIPGTTVYSYKIADTDYVPCFAIHNGYLYFGADPAVLVKAATAADSPKVTEQAKLAALLKQIEAPANFASFRYSDLPATAPDTLDDIDELWPEAVAAAKEEGIPLPANPLPPREKLLPLLAPAIGVTWADDKGFYSREREPFPGAAVGFGYAHTDEMTTVGATALGVSILLPSLNRARESANRVKSMANLRSMGQMTHQYANNNNGSPPPNLGTLLAMPDLGPNVTAQIFISPGSATTLPADIHEPAKWVEWVNTHSDYVYLNHGVDKIFKIRNAANAPLVYEKIGLRRGGTNVLFVDGHVEFVNVERARELVRQVTGADPVQYHLAKRLEAVPLSPTTAPGRPR